MKIKIKTSKGEAVIELNDSDTSNKIFESLPINGEANLWGDEIYFEIPLFLEVEEDFERQEMNVGDVAYWPPGNAFCIFFGKTPASVNEKPRAASEVTFLGKVDNIEIFKDVKNEEDISLEK